MQTYIVSMRNNLLRVFSYVFMEGDHEDFFPCCHMKKQLAEGDFYSVVPFPLDSCCFLVYM